MSPMIRPVPTMLPSRRAARFSGDGGTISAIGFPKRVMRIGLRVLRTCFSKRKQLDLNSEKETSFICCLRTDQNTPNVKGGKQECPPKRDESYSDHATQLLHSRRALVEPRLLFPRQFDLDNLLDSLCPQFHRDADIEAADTVLALQESSARQDFLFVFEDRLDHLGSCGRGRVIRRAGLQVLHDFRPAIASALHQAFELRFFD